jgi:hypothetical protein
VTIPACPATWRDSVASLHSERDARFAEIAGEAFDDYRQTARDRLAVLLEGRELRIRMRPSDLERWLQDGRHLTFHTTGQTNGLMDPRARLTVEEEMMGIDPGAGDEERPRYGYVQGSAEQGRELNRYGNVLVRLEDELRDRATVTLGDSLGSTTTRPGIYAGWPCMVPERLSTGGGIDCRFPCQDVTQASQLNQACDEYYEYAEVQIYEPLQPSHIKQVTFCGGSRASGELRRLIRQWGINSDEIGGFPA